MGGVGRGFAPVAIERMGVDVVQLRDAACFLPGCVMQRPDDVQMLAGLPIAIRRGIAYAHCAVQGVVRLRAVVGQRIVGIGESRAESAGQSCVPLTGRACNTAEENRAGRCFRLLGSCSMAAA